MTGQLLALTDLGWGEHVIRILAVVGGAVLGGLGFAWLVGLIVKTSTTHLPPRWVTIGLRFAGGFLCGWLVYLVAFGGGDTFLGGIGNRLFGWTGGPGKENNKVEVSPDKDKQTRDEPKDPKKEEKKPSDSDPEDARKDTVQVEVLGNNDLERILKSGSFDRERRYRLGPRRLKVSREPRKLLEVKKIVRELLATRPELQRIQIVLYTDSPSEQDEQVTGLMSWAQDLIVKGEQGNKDKKVSVEFPRKLKQPAPLD